MKRLNRLLLVLLLIFSLIGGMFTLSGQAAVDLNIPEIKYAHFQLDNGLQIYVLEDHQLPLVNFSMWYRAGSVDEPEGLSGISHFLEHNMFLGTETLDEDEIDDLIYSVGGDLNAFTSQDLTCYTHQLPASKLELVVALEADRMRNLEVVSEEFEREREVVLQERREMIENDVLMAGMEEIQAKAFANTPLEHQVLGWREDIKEIELEDIYDYYHQYYAPNNAVMVVSGAVKPEEAYELAKKYYADYKPQVIERKEFEFSKPKEEQVIELEKPTQVPIMQLIYKTPSADHQDSVAIGALLDILVNNSSSRITQKLRREQEMILNGGAFRHELRTPGMSLIYLVLPSEEFIEPVQREFDSQLEKIIKEGVSEEELEVVRNSVLKDFMFRQRNTSSAAQLIAESAVRFDNPDLYKEKIKEVKRLSEEDIIRVAKKYFQPEKRTVGYILPQW